MDVDATHDDAYVSVDRREFIKTGIKTVAKTAVQVADEHVRQRAVRWIRPPYALPELDFLLACTRCDKCVEACPHDVLFKLSAGLGSQVASTPALDLLNKGCHLCDDWPCVEACEPRALKYPYPENNEQPALPILAGAEIDTDICLPYQGPECGACAASCPVPGAMLWTMEKPDIDANVCTGCGLCREACIVKPKAVKISSLQRSHEAATRENSS